MSEITISHTHADGTILEGSSRGDGVWEILRGLRDNWWFTKGPAGFLYIKNTRDRAARLVAIETAAKELEAAGHTVTVEIDDTVRDNATVREAQHERLEDRRAALKAKGEKLAAKSEALHRASDAMVEHLPLGQPVMPGKRGQAHRRLLERSVDTAINGALTAQEAKRMPARIEGSRRAEAYKERPDVTARRVERLEAELRSLDRRMARLSMHPETGSETLRKQYEGERAVLVERIARDRKVLEEATAAGLYGQYSKTNVHKGDRILIRGRWRQVARSNPKSVSVTTGYSWTDRYGWEEVRGLRCDHVEDPAEGTTPAAEDAEI
ncbi:DUF3560 domain-containing protein [Streptomyces halobius]|uniref:DUF3560 domain-containing protein n=1 Tax=Streptomyces halobius TaxID=2879846 RepID=A0ABY4MD58_9ACTN|nr:DUF3560 domain-containing protein [Streptomyces halobius]UQA95648.1 DUF3560 domain-containing protein [Streptomyces halobius]